MTVMFVRAMKMLKKLTTAHLQSVSKQRKVSTSITRLEWKRFHLKGLMKQDVALRKDKQIEKQNGRQNCVESQPQF